MLKVLTLYVFTVALAIPLTLNLLPQPASASGLPARPSVSESDLIQATTAYTLYDGSLRTTPDNQGFSYLALGGGSQMTTTGGTRLNTLPLTATYAGYVNRPEQTPILDRAHGYTINFAIQILAEAHHGSDRNSDGLDDRAGFSLTVLSSDSYGIELGFWTNEIWAQDDGADDPDYLFTHAEGVTLTTTRLISYNLAVLSNTYTLSIAGSPVLSGSLRNYSAFVPPFPGLPNPYTSTNFIFLGDNSGSARSQVKITGVSVSLMSTATITDNSNYLPLILEP